MSKISKLWLAEELLEVILEDIEHWAPLETGGVLMGYTAENGDVVVTDIIGPGPGAMHRAASFSPDQDYQLNEINRVFQSPDSSSTYLGDWHSHPTSSPLMSSRDKRTLINISKCPESQCPHPVMLIIGALPECWTPNAIRLLQGSFKYYFFPEVQLQHLTLTID